jgi:excisionase family DNA binding protein
MKQTSVVGSARRSWSIKEVAVRNSLSSAKIREEIKRGHLHAKRVGRRILILDEAEQRWLHSLPSK